MNRTTIRNSLAMIAAAALSAGAAQAAQPDNREIGHHASAVDSQAITAATGVNSREVGHFALKASGPATSTADFGGVIGGSESLPR